jgi:undecaprenyl-diphosphatase
MQPPGTDFRRWGLVLLAGALAVSVATWLLVLLVVHLAGPVLLAADADVLLWFDLTTGTRGDRIALYVTQLGSRVYTGVLMLLASATLWRRRRAAVLYLWTAYLGTLIGDLQKLWFGRARPELVDWGVHVSSLSFPSGHALAATVTYGALAYVLLGRARGIVARAAVVGGAVLIILAVGWSRVQLGVHYPSDVLGGWLVGVFWLLVAVRAAPPDASAVAVRKRAGSG